MVSGHNSRVIRGGLVLAVALYLGFSSYSLVCDLHHSLPTSHASHQSHSAPPHASPLCALAHSPISAIPIAPEPVLQVTLMVAMALVLQAFVPSVPTLLSRHSRAPPV
jgi:hypothetical protein